MEQDTDSNKSSNSNQNKNFNPFKLEKLEQTESSDNDNNSRDNNNDAVRGFDQANMAQFDSWYGVDEITYITHTAEQLEFLRYVFFDGGVNSFEQQFESLLLLRSTFVRNEQASSLNNNSINNNYNYGKEGKGSIEIKGISFICKEPGASQNHFMFGTLLADKLIIINPTGLTRHHDFYEFLEKSSKEGFFSGRYKFSRYRL